MIRTNTATTKTRVTPWMTTISLLLVDILDTEVLSDLPIVHAVFPLHTSFIMLPPLLYHYTTVPYWTGLFLIPSPFLGFLMRFVSIPSNHFTTECIPPPSLSLFTARTALFSRHAMIDFPPLIGGLVISLMRERVVCQSLTSRTDYRPFPFRRFSYGPTLNPTGRVRAVIFASERFFRRFAEQSIGERFFRCRCWGNHMRPSEMYERPRAFCHTCLRSKQYDVHIPSSIHQS